MPYKNGITQLALIVASLMTIGTATAQNKSSDVLRDTYFKQGELQDRRSDRAEERDQRKENRAERRDQHRDNRAERRSDRVEHRSDRAEQRGQRRENRAERRDQRRDNRAERKQGRAIRMSRGGRASRSSR